MAIQFTGMIVHRFGSLLHIVANRKEIAEKKKQNDMVNLMKKGIQENPDLNQYRMQDDEQPTEWEKDKVQRKKSRIFSSKRKDHPTHTYQPLKQGVDTKQGVDIQRRLTRLNEGIRRFQRNKDKPVDREFRSVVKSLGGRRNTMRTVNQIQVNSTRSKPFSDPDQTTNNHQPLPDYY